MIGTMSAGQMLFFLALAVLLFGNRLPAVGKSLGEGIRNFKKGLNGQEDGDPTTTTSTNEKTAATAAFGGASSPQGGAPNPSAMAEVVAHAPMNPQLQPPNSVSQTAQVVDVEHKV